jgi:hypothetical protein
MERESLLRIISGLFPVSPPSRKKNPQRICKEGKEIVQGPIRNLYYLQK